MNALMYDYFNDEIIDLCDGINDIKNKVINSLTQKGFVKTSENYLTKGEIEIYINTYSDTVRLSLTRKQSKLPENDSDNNYRY